MSLSNHAWSLVPVDSLILGANDSDISDNSIDPLNYVFSSNNNWNNNNDSTDNKIMTSQNDKKQIMQFLSMIINGNKLQKICNKQTYLSYPSPEEMIIAQRSLLATLQFIGLDLTVRGITEYAKTLEFSKEEFKNLTIRLLNNYCSTNLTVISLRQLYKNLITKFNSEKSNYTLPNFSTNKLFTPNINKRINITMAQEQEFLRTIKLFRAFCSWNGDLENYRLLVPIIKNPLIMNFIIEQVSSIQTIWDINTKKFIPTPSDKTVQIICENLICRPLVDRNTFAKRFPRSIGGKNIEEDLKVLYCNKLQDVKYTYNNQESHIKKWINNQTIEDENFMISQFLALLTGVLDPVSKVQKYSELKEVLRSSLDNDWDLWAQNASNTFVTDLLYEESITIEVVPRNKLNVSFSSSKISNDPLDFAFYSPTTDTDADADANADADARRRADSEKHFSIAFDINFGEFDRTTQAHGKIAASYKLSLPESFLSWFKHQWIQYAHPKYKDKRNKLQNVLEQNLQLQIEEMRKKFLIPPWEGNLNQMISSEIIERLEEDQCPTLLRRSDNYVKIPIIFRYGVWALKYINYRFNLLHGKPQIEN